MKEIQWSSQAFEQLMAAYNFIFDENPPAAAAHMETILKAAEQLAAFPHLGRIGRISHTRELVIPGTPYIAVYRIRGTTIRILALLHGARRWPTHF